MSVILQLNDIKFGIDYQTKTHNNLLNGITLEVEEGKATALIGGNGTGKTTLFNIISGFQSGYSGSIYFCGERLKRLRPEKIARKGIGRLFQGGQMLAGLSLMENMKLASSDRTGEIPFSASFLPRKRKKAEENKEKHAREVLQNLFGENNTYLLQLDKDASEFSYGEQRLLQLACLLMQDYKLLLLDEPTSGINNENINIIKRVIKDNILSQKVAVLLIEHNTAFVKEIADKCAYIEDGVIADYGDTNQVLDSPRVQKSYLGIGI